MSLVCVVGWHSWFSSYCSLDCVGSGEGLNVIKPVWLGAKQFKSGLMPSIAIAPKIRMNVYLCVCACVSTCMSMYWFCYVCMYPAQWTWCPGSTLLCCYWNNIPINQPVQSDVTKIKKNKLEWVMKHFVIIVSVRRHHRGTVGGTATSQLGLLGLLGLQPGLLRVLLFPPNSSSWTDYDK